VWSSHDLMDGMEQCECIWANERMFRLMNMDMNMLEFAISSCQYSTVQYSTVDTVHNGFTNDQCCMVASIRYIADEIVEHQLLLMKVTAPHLSRSTAEWPAL